MGKRIRKAIGALLVAVAIAVTQIPVSDVEAVDTASASDFQMDGTTLVKYNGTAENVSVSDTVKRIEAEAFADNDFVKKVTIGANVESIGTSAFEGCSQLQTVEISDSVKTIAQAAFADCPSLNKVEVGIGLEELGNGVFAGDISLSNVNFSSSNPKFICDDGAIYNKNGRDTLYALLSGRKSDSYKMPSTVSKIKPYAFWGDKNLETVFISSNVGEISAYAFSNCCNLTKVDMPYSVKGIGIKAFEDCIRLRNIVIPASVNTIHATAFDGCTKLKIEAEEGSVAKNYADNLVLEDIDVAEYEDTSIDTVNGTVSESSDGENDAGDTEKQTEAGKVDYYHEVTHINPLETEEDASVKGKTKIIGSQAFVFVDNASATVNSGEPDLNKVEGVAFGETGETIASISGNLDGKGGSFPKYTIIDEKIIANQAYYNDARTSIEIPDTITEIGDFAFARSAITSVVIPEGATKIGYAAFYHCDSLTDVVIPETVTEIEPSAFAKTPWLQNWEQNGSGEFLIVGDGILLAYRGSNSTVAIPDGVKTIGAGAFAGHAGITKVILSDSVDIIGEGAFSGCNNLTQLEGGDALRQIKDRAFRGCPLQNIKISDLVEEIGLRAFAVSNTVKEDKSGVVVFEGTSLPEISYEASSGKLYNDAYRGLVFDGVEIAVVPNNVEAFEGTVLDEKLSGFRGVICTMESDHVLKIRKMPIDGSSLVSYPDTVSIDGKDYQLDKVQIPRENNAGTAYTEESAEEGDMDSAQKGVIVQISSDTIENDNLASAVIDGAEESYILKIVDSDSADNAIQAAYQKVYGDKLPENLQAYEIALQEVSTSIPITGLGKQKIEITIPFPQGIGEENLHVVCLDANGQLEEADSRISVIDGVECITFSTNHFSPYGIYNYTAGNTAVVNNGQAVFTSLSSHKDDSPDTGDNSIHPKWFLGAGLFFMGMAMFFYRGKKRVV